MLLFERQDDMLDVVRHCLRSEGVVKVDIQFKVEKGRVLVPVGVPCPFGCKYCYTRSGEVGPARVSPETILFQLQQFATQHTFSTIQFGYDSDPFAFPERGLAMLQQLAMLGKNINFSTKAFIEGESLNTLAQIQQSMIMQTTMSALVSLSCWGSASHVEPHTPTPAERLCTVKNLKQIDIPTFIAVRPILPHIAEQEYEHMVEAALDAGCDGFILGPLYADAKGRFVKFIPKDILRQVPGRQVVVSWSAHEPLWIRYEDQHRLQQIIAMVEQKGGRVFTSSADAVQSVSHEPVMPV
jgi:DNA repair photolyase